MGRIHFIFALVLLPMVLPAQNPEWMEVRDTSYFLAENDEWNLVESVLRSEHANIFLLLNRGTNPDARAKGGMTALMYAAEKGDSLALQLLILNGADMEFTLVEETTPLMVAVLNRHFSSAHYLLRSGANPNAVDAYGATSLLYAAALNDYQMTDLLLFYGADDSFRDKQGNDALMTATTLAHLETADVLLQNGVPPDGRDKSLRSPLMIASQGADTAMAILLLEYHASLEAFDTLHYTPLCHAVRSGDVNMVKVLADSGANIHYQISARQNIYDLSKQIQTKDISRYLASQGAAPSPRPDFSELRLSWGNSFSADEHLMQLRAAWVDSKFGFFVETGFDIRPTLRKRQLRENDSLVYQYREQRWVWAHGLGKDFALIRDPKGVIYGAYAGIYGFLSSPSYLGIGGFQGLQYDLALSGGLYMQGEIAGIRAGADRYSFGSLLENKWKINISLFLRIPFKQNDYHAKEISY